MKRSIGIHHLVIWALVGLALWELASPGPLSRQMKPPAFATSFEQHNNVQEERAKDSASSNTSNYSSYVASVEEHEEKQSNSQDQEPRQQNKPQAVLPKIPIDDFRLCRADSNTQYFCQGPVYDDFADRMQEHILELNRTQQKPPFWGRRSSPSPLANKTILFFGNSHTRQVFDSLACQYQAERLSFTGSELVLPNNVRGISITNHLLVYSPDWATLLRNATGGYGLEDFDAIVLGRFNDKDNTRGTNFEKWIRKQIANQTGNISFDAYPPPGIQQVANVFPKPIILTSMFAKYSRRFFNKQVQEAERIMAASGGQQQPRGGRMIPAVDARAYVEALGECGNDQHKGGGTCHFKGELNATRLPSSMHRCVGPRGGHPSLAVWDIIEELHRTLVPPVDEQL
jgi:hypothetical protein